MRKLIDYALALERAAVAIGCLSLLALMCVVSTDVLMRYAFNSPFIWTHDVVTLYLMPMIFFLLVSDSFREGAQIRVDIFYEHFNANLRRGCDAVGSLMTAGVIALILYGGLLQAIHAVENREVVAGSIPWPVWPSYALLVAGSTMLIFRLAVTALSSFFIGQHAGVSSESGVRP